MGGNLSKIANQHVIKPHMEQQTGTAILHNNTDFNIKVVWDEHLRSIQYTYSDMTKNLQRATFILSENITAVSIEREEGHLISIVPK